MLLAALADAIDYRDQITLGSIIVGLLVALGTLITLGYGVRYRTAWEVEKANADVLREGRDAYRGKADRLEDEKAELLRTAAEQRETISRLEALPNMERVVQMLAETADRADRRADERLTRGLQLVERIIDGHEARAIERHAEQVQVLQAIERRLNAAA